MLNLFPKSISAISGTNTSVVSVWYTLSLTKQDQKEMGKGTTAKTKKKSHSDKIYKESTPLYPMSMI